MRSDRVPYRIVVLAQTGTHGEIHREGMGSPMSVERSMGLGCDAWLSDSMDKFTQQVPISADLLNHSDMC